MINLKNKVAVITGAGSGIGAGVAKKFFDLGSHLIMIGKTEHNVQKVAKELGNDNRIDYYACDVNDEKRLNDVKDTIISKRNRIDMLVTCAAAPGASGKLEETSFAEWRSVLSTDLDGVFLSCKIFGGAMKKNGYGRIVNLTSFHNIATYPERVVYNAAKSGVEGFSRGLAVEWAAYGITVNSVAPGPIRTPRTSGFLAQSPDVEFGMLGRTPNVRLGETEDVANLIAFLVSEEAKHINGQQIVIDGGWTKSAWWGNHTHRK
jgi:meso-butanediol dehydrogenase / (S,S)-butanediol dehydrogenase / diacetyl reductase